MEVTEWFEKQWNLIIQRFGHEAGDHHIGLSRLNKMFDILTGKTLPQFEHKAQKPYTFYLPGLPATPFHDPASFPFCSILEQNSPIIRQELLALIHQQEEENDSKFQVYSGDGLTQEEEPQSPSSTSTSTMVSAGDWRVFYFYKNFKKVEENCRKCPKTAELLELQQESSSDILLKGMVCYSSILPGTHILPHTGPSNMRLTCHLGLLGCQGAEIAVGSEKRSFVENKCLVFDDSFVHQVWHQGKERRVTLMLDFWHPDMTPLEKAAFQMVMVNSSREILDQEFFYHRQGRYSIHDF